MNKRHTNSMLEIFEHSFISFRKDFLHIFFMIISWKKHIEYFGILRAMFVFIPFLCNACLYGWCDFCFSSFVRRWRNVWSLYFEFVYSDFLLFRNAVSWLHVQYVYDLTVSFVSFHYLFHVGLSWAMLFLVVKHACHSHFVRCHFYVIWRECSLFGSIL